MDVFLQMDVTYHLKLFIAGLSPKSKLALANLNAFCEENLQGPHILEIIDLALNPELAEEHGILAIPTLRKVDPEPVKRLIGNFTDKDRLLSAMNISAA